VANMCLRVRVAAVLLLSFAAHVDGRPHHHRGDAHDRKARAAAAKRLKESAKRLEEEDAVPPSVPSNTNALRLEEEEEDVRSCNTAVLYDDCGIMAVTLFEFDLPQTKKDPDVAELTKRHEKAAGNVCVWVAKDKKNPTKSGECIACSNIMRYLSDEESAKGGSALSSMVVGFVFFAANFNHVDVNGNDEKAMSDDSQYGQSYYQKMLDGRFNDRKIVVDKRTGFAKRKKGAEYLNHFEKSDVVPGNLILKQELLDANGGSPLMNDASRLKLNKEYAQYVYQGEERLKNYRYRASVIESAGTKKQSDAMNSCDYARIIMDPPQDCAGQTRGLWQVDGCGCCRDKDPEYPNGEFEPESTGTFTDQQMWEGPARDKFSTPAWIGQLTPDGDENSRRCECGEWKDPGKTRCNSGDTGKVVDGCPGAFFGEPYHMARGRFCESPKTTDACNCCSHTAANEQYFQRGVNKYTEAQVDISRDAQARRGPECGCPERDDATAQCLDPKKPDFCDNCDGDIETLPPCGCHKNYLDKTPDYCECCTNERGKDYTPFTKETGSFSWPGTKPERRKMVNEQCECPSMRNHVPDMHKDFDFSQYGRGWIGKVHFQKDCDRASTCLPKDKEKVALNVCNRAKKWDKCGECGGKGPQECSDGKTSWLCKESPCKELAPKMQTLCNDPGSAKELCDKAKAEGYWPLHVFEDVDADAEALEEDGDLVEEGGNDSVEDSLIKAQELEGVMMEEEETACRSGGATAHPKACSDQQKKLHQGSKKGSGLGANAGNVCIWVEYEPMKYRDADAKAWGKKWVQDGTEFIASGSCYSCADTTGIRKSPDVRGVILFQASGKQAEYLADTPTDASAMYTTTGTRDHPVHTPKTNFYQNLLPLPARFPDAFLKKINMEGKSFGREVCMAPAPRDPPKPKKPPPPPFYDCRNPDEDKNGVTAQTQEELWSFDACGCCRSPEDASRSRLECRCPNTNPIDTGDPWEKTEDSSKLSAGEDATGKKRSLEESLSEECKVGPEVNDCGVCPPKTPMTEPSCGDYLGKYLSEICELQGHPSTCDLVDPDTKSSIEI